MAQWLYGLIKKNDADRTPDFARQSHLNWARALSFEVIQEHGATVADQWESLRRHFSGKVARRQIGEDHQVSIFEPMFASMQFSASLVSLAARGDAAAWECPPATVTWYYANYNALRAMLAAQNQAPADTHAAVIRALNGEVRKLLPHPYNMVATRQKDEQYDDSLPCYPAARRAGGATAAINGAFVEQRDAAQRMLLEYLTGSAAYWSWVAKEKILAGGKVKDFRTKAAREERNRRLKDEVNFLDCAFRYRGKANYRDAIFLSYGQVHAGVGPPFVTDLAKTARFATLMALAFIKCRVGDALYGSFARDVQDNFAGANMLHLDFA